MEAVASRRGPDVRRAGWPSSRDDPEDREIDGDSAVLDAQDLTTRQINLELRWLLYEQGVTT